MSATATLPAAVHDRHPDTPTAHFDLMLRMIPHPMSDDGQQRQCRRGITPDVELGAALALADMAAGSSAVQAQAQVRLHTAGAGAEGMTDEEEMASTRLSLQLGRVGVQQSPSCSSSSSAGRPSGPPPAPAPSAAPGAAAHHGPRPRHMLTEAEEEKRLRRVLANRESARQTILRRQAIRDELARKVADLSSQNETMKKEKDVVMKEYLSLKETNEQLKAQAHHLSLSLF